jgi:hypothetical protein
LTIANSNKCFKHEIVRAIYFTIGNITCNKAIQIWVNGYCSKATLTGESRFHISTSLGIEPGSLMTGSKRVGHWTSGTVYECSEIASSPQGSPPPPQQPTMSVVKPEGEPAASMKPGQKSCVRSSGIITLSVRRPSDGLG